MKTQIVYGFDENGWLTGPTEATESPLEPGVLLLPANSTAIQPPDFAEGRLARFDGKVWTVAEHPTVTRERAEKEQREIQQAEADARITYRDRRAASYPAIGDQLDALFKFLGTGDRAEVEKVIDQIADVKKRFPKEAPKVSQPLHMPARGLDDLADRLQLARNPKDGGG